MSKAIREADVQAARRRSLIQACRCAQAAEDLRGQQTVVLDLTSITPMFDYFVISTGTSPRQMRALAEEVLHQMKATGQTAIGTEGVTGGSTWILYDFGDIVLHVFTAEARHMYDLEHLWADAPQIDWKGELARHPEAAAKT